MAKKHEAAESFFMESGRKENVDSNVYTLKFDVTNGTEPRDGVFEVRKGQAIINPDLLKNDKGRYLYGKMITVPALAKLESDDSLGAVIQQFCDDLRGYDGASTIRTTVKRKNAQGQVEDQEVSGQRWFTICVDEEGKPCSPEKYLALLIEREHRLGIQKRTYKPQREKAIADFRTQLDLAEPTKKARTKRKEGVEDEDASI